jgi:hypothetical protein
MGTPPPGATQEESGALDIDGGGEEGEHPDVQAPDHHDDEAPQSEAQNRETRVEREPPPRQDDEP